MTVRAVAVEVDAAVRDAFARWYEHVHVPDVLACDGWLSARRYECDTRFMTLYEIDSAARPFASDAFRAIAHWGDFAPHIRGASRRSFEPVLEGHDRLASRVRIVEVESAGEPVAGEGTTVYRADDPVWLLSCTGPWRWRPDGAVVRWSAADYELVSARSAADSVTYPLGGPWQTSSRHR